MHRVAIAHVDRPGLSDALAARGIATADAPGGADGAVIGWHGPPAQVAGRLVPLRADGIGPVMVLLKADDVAAHDDMVIAALDAGADDAACGDVSNAVIAARIAALLRRSSRVFRIGALTIDPVDRRVARDGRDIPLLPREYRLLIALARRPGEVVDRATLLKEVCGIGFDPGTNALDVHMSRLRAKIDRGHADAMLQTERRRGFRLSA